MIQTEEEVVQRVESILKHINAACSGQKGADVYMALMFALGKTIAQSHDPAQVLVLTIPKLASAAGVQCRQLDEDTDLEELEDDNSVATH
jgi:hypothetical protein